MVKCGECGRQFPNKATMVFKHGRIKFLICGEDLKRLAPQFHKKGHATPGKRRLSILAGKCRTYNHKMRRGIEA